MLNVQFLIQIVLIYFCDTIRAKIMPKLFKCFEDMGIRCNSKASYLPRQSLEKLNSSDPDHGSYKLTLTSNEDLVGHAKPAYDILALNGKLPSNLPDVLPLGAKLQPQPTSPTSASGGAILRCGSGAVASSPQTAACYPHLYPTQHRYSTPAMSNAKNYYNHSNNNNNNQTANYSRSQSCDVNSNPCIINPSKFMSQSALDLKKAHNLETTMEETTTTTSATSSLVEDSQGLLSPAQSENNLSSSAYNQNQNNNKHTTPSTTTKSPSPYTARREFHHRSDMMRTLSLEDRNDSTEGGRIVRAELVNTTLATSPCNSTSNSGKASVTRKDSLRENIEKITQLQSQLMSAHLSDSGLLNNYGVANKAAGSQVPPRPAEEERKTLPPPPIEEQSSKQTVEQTVEQNSLSPHSNVAEPLSPSQHKQPGTECDSLNEVVMAQISQMDCNTDGLKLMQRSEIILRVNPLTVEAASQTDDMADGDMGRLTESHQHNKEDAQTCTTLQPRQRHPIEMDCDQLCRELAKLLAPNDKLIALLTPSVVKSPADYVSNLYNPNVAHRPTKRDVGTSTLMRMRSQRETMHEAAAEKSSVVTVELQYAEINGNGPDSCDMLKRKVDELIHQLNCKLTVLNKEQATIGEEAAINDELGSGLVEKLSDKVRPLESTKFRTYIDDVGHITSLLLSLSERLAKTENSLSTIDDAENTEKKTLETKRDRLLEQLEEAKRLKEDIERRGGSLTGMLKKHLSADEFADFDYFINMKAKLIADARDLADKIKSGEEQLNALGEALMQSDC